MNDDELITAVRESVTGVHMDTPAARIVSRGHAIRARRRIPGLAGAVAAVAGAALAVPMLLAGGNQAGHQVSHQATAQLAAWTVTTQANGGIRITVRELRDPAGLQRTLRTDGVPASVTFSGHANPACRGFPLGGDPSQRLRRLRRIVTAGRGPNVVVIHPHALPSGAGLQIVAQFRHDSGPRPSLTVRLVKATPRCTGS